MLPKNWPTLWKLARSSAYPGFSYLITENGAPYAVLSNSPRLGWGFAPLLDGAPGQVLGGYKRRQDALEDLTERRRARDAGEPLNLN